MQYDKQQIDQLKHYAECMMTVDEVAILMNIDRYQLKEDVNDRTSPAFVYRRTMVEKALELRESEMELARAGSPAAIQNAIQFLNRMQKSLE